MNNYIVQKNDRSASIFIDSMKEDNDMQFSGSRFQSVIWFVKNSSIFGGNEEESKAALYYQTFGNCKLDQTISAWNW